MNNILFNIANAAASPQPTLTVNTSTSTPEELFINIINLILPIIAGVAILFVVYGGFLYITSQGEPEKLEKAKKTLFWAIIGVVLVVLSYSIVVSLGSFIDKNII